jgi:hypothetical protein
MAHLIIQQVKTMQLIMFHGDKDGDEISSVPV